jgi:large subunit ribosomal protein L18
MTVQFIQFDPKGDKILSSATGRDLEKFGWKGSAVNTPAAYLTGYLAGIRAQKAGITEAVLDIGLATPTKGSRIFATLKGMVDSGMNIPHGEEVLPSEERIRGEHINEGIKTQFEATITKLEGAK